MLVFFDFPIKGLFRESFLDTLLFSLFWIIVVHSINKQLAVLSPAEKAALYEIPDFDEEQRLEYFNFTPEEEALMRNQPSLLHQTHCALQIGYFKAKHFFFKVDWKEMQEDVNFILQQYFDGKTYRQVALKKQPYYAQCHAIATHFGYQFWAKDFEPELLEQSQQALRKDVSPQFIVMELLEWLRNKKIIRPRYTTLQGIVSKAINLEFNRLEKLMDDSLSDHDKSTLQALLVEDGTLSQLAELKRDPKEFKARMMSAEREKFTALKPLYLLAKNILPILALSKQNMTYYGSLIHYYTIYELRKKIRPTQAYLYLLCYIRERYCQLNDNSVDAFLHHLKQMENELKPKSQNAFAEHVIQQHHHWQNERVTLRRLAQVFVDQEVRDDIQFGQVRKKVFDSIAPREQLQGTAENTDDNSLKKMDFTWLTISEIFPRYKSHLRPIIMTLDFSSITADSLWLSAITWLKNVFSRDKPLNQYPFSDFPEGTLPSRLNHYFTFTNDKGEKKLHGDRYEFWVYRQLKKRLKSGELYLSDSIQHRSLQEELNEAKTNGAQSQTLDLPSLNESIKERLDKKFAELDMAWETFNTDLAQGKLTHLEFDEEKEILHLRKSNDEKEPEYQHNLYSQLPLCDISDVLQFVNEQCNYSSAFTHIQPRYAKQPINEKGLRATIIAQAVNNGNLKMAELSNIPYDSLLDIYKSRLRLQTLKAGNDNISNDIADMSIFPYYSLDIAVLYGGVDGQKYEVANPTIKAKNSKKYFKKGKGVVAYTLLASHIPLQVELIGAHEHESYFAFDIWYNNTSNILPDALTGDSHLMNKINFAIMDWFGGSLFPRFTHLQSQLKHLYCTDDLSKYSNFLIKPVGQINRQLIEEEWENIKPIISALGLKNITQSTLVKKLCTYSTDNCTRKAIMEYDKLIRSIYTLKYFRDRKLQQNVHRSQNRVEAYHQLRAAIATAYGKKYLSGRSDREVEISNQCGRLIANAIIHYNSAILSKLLKKFEAEGHTEGIAMLKKISPVAWQHINFHGHFIFSDDGKRINIDEMVSKLGLLTRKLRKSSKACAEISEVCG